MNNVLCDLSFEELMDINGGSKWGDFWTGVGAVAGGITVAVTVGKALATAATVSVAAGLAGGIAIVGCGAVAAYGVAYAINAVRK